MKYDTIFKNKIAARLSLYFAISLIVFSMVIAAIFVFLFRNYTISIHKQDIEQRAETIAQNAAYYISSTGMVPGQGGFFRFLGDIARADVWIIDEDFNIVTPPEGHMMASKQLQYASLPVGIDSLIKEVFEGKVVYSNEFSSLLSEMALTVGVPIKSNEDSSILGIVLLHSPIRGTDKALYNGFIILGVSIVIALIIAQLLSIGFSLSFTKPLNQMRNTALTLAKGDYSAKTKVCQYDEIGELASALDVLAEQLQAASLQSENLDKMRKDFFANISHELKTPVTVIRGSLEALIDKVVDKQDEIESYYLQMYNESIYLQRLISDLLELSKLQNSEFIIEKQDLSIKEILDDVIRSITPIAISKGISINSIIENEIGYIYGDYGRLRQMLFIVLDNAVKFSDKANKIDFLFENDEIIIRDYGIGISENELPYIFERFYKSRSELNKTGTGLGLAIANQIAERHGISINVISTEGKGTIFTFKIP